MLWHIYRLTDGVTHRVGRAIKCFNLACEIASSLPGGEVRPAYSNHVAWTRGIETINAEPIPQSPALHPAQLHPRICRVTQ